MHDGGENELSFRETSKFCRNGDEGSQHPWIENNLRKVTRVVLSTEPSAMVQMLYICAIQCINP